MMNYLLNETMTMDSLKSRRTAIKSELKHMPDESLLISNNKSGVSFLAITWENGKRNMNGIAKDECLIYKLAHKAYLLELLKRLENNIEVLEKANGKLMSLEYEDIRTSFPKNFNLLQDDAIINPHILSSKGMLPKPIGDGSIKPLMLFPTLGEMFTDQIITIDEWFAMPYCENTSYLENKKHITASGLKVRSKSEGLCISCYNTRKVRYHYDETFIAGTGWISPDAILLRSDGSFLIHEHGGFPDNDEYMRSFYSKLGTYYKAGFQLGKNLIVTFDNRNGDIDMRLLNTLLDDYYY